MQRLIKLSFSVILSMYILHRCRMGMLIYNEIKSICVGFVAGGGNSHVICEGDTPYWYAIFSGGGVDGTQYEKSRYAVRKNPVISYADINFYV